MKHEGTEKLYTRKDFLKTSACAVTFGFLRTGCLRTSSIPRVRLGKTGLEVSPICYGASRTQEASLVRKVYEDGIDFFDTGRSYANGQNEVMLGNTLKDVRDRVKIQSKMYIRMRETGEALKTPEAAAKITRRMEDALEASLEALRTDCIDILLSHNVQTAELLFHDTVLENFRRFKSEGMIKAFGFSIHNNHLDVLEQACERPVYDIVMVPFNFKGSYVHSLSGRYTEWDQERLIRCLKRLHAQDVGIIAMKTCSAGPFSISGSGTPSYRNAIRWVLDQDFIDSAAVAMGNFEQIEEDLSALV